MMIPTIIIVGEVGFFEKSIDRCKADAHGRLPIIIGRIPIDENLIGIDGYLRRLIRQQHFNAKVLSPIASIQAGGSSIL